MCHEVKQDEGGSYVDGVGIYPTSTLTLPSWVGVDGVDTGCMECTSVSKQGQPAEKPVKENINQLHTPGHCLVSAKVYNTVYIKR